MVSVQMFLLEKGASMRVELLTRTDYSGIRKGVFYKKNACQHSNFLIFRAYFPVSTIKKKVLAIPVNTKSLLFSSKLISDRLFLNDLQMIKKKLGLKSTSCSGEVTKNILL